MITQQITSWFCDTCMESWYDEETAYKHECPIIYGKKEKKIMKITKQAPKIMKYIYKKYTETGIPTDKEIIKEFQKLPLPFFKATLQYLRDIEFIDLIYYFPGKDDPLRFEIRKINPKGIEYIEKEE